jgi:hypothetical protein
MGWRRAMIAGAGLSVAVGVGWVTIRAGALLGRGLLRQLGRIGSLQPFSIFLISFLFFFFYFPISSIQFATMLQIISNHFQIFCKIQNSHLK